MEILGDVDVFFVLFSCASFRSTVEFRPPLDADVQLIDCRGLLRDAWGNVVRFNFMFILWVDKKVVFLFIVTQAFYGLVHCSKICDVMG